MRFDDLLDDLLRDGISVRFVARGDSMHPTIRSGEPVHVARVDQQLLGIGDVVLVRSGRGLTAHRIVSFEHGSIVTRGDNAVRADAALPIEDVLGKVVAVERAGRTLPLASTGRHWLRRPLSWIRSRVRGIA